MQKKICDLSRRSGVSIDTLRYYERIGLLPRTPRDAGGWRVFDEAALVWLAFLGRLKTTGMPLTSMRRYATLHAAGPSAANERKDLLASHRTQVVARMADMQAALLVLDTKIAGYGPSVGQETPTP